MLSAYPYNLIHPGIIVDDIRITTREDLKSYGVNDQNINLKFITDTGKWFTKKSAGEPDEESPTIPGYKEGNLYLVTVEGIDSTGRQKKYIMATWTTLRSN